jgi:predicted HAD superfamily hydrolase
VFTKNWNFMEFLMTAPEYPIKKLGANGKPVYDAKPTDAEKFRCKIYPYVSDGAVD